MVFALGASTLSCWNTPLGDCRYACGPEGRCPHDMVCIAGMCARGGVTCPPAADASVDAGDGSTEGQPADRTDASEAAGPEAPDSSSPSARTDANPPLDERGDDGNHDDGDHVDSSPSEVFEARETSSDTDLVPVSPGIVFARSKLWKAPSITACWEQPGLEEEKQWVADAVADSWTAVSAVRISGWGDCDARGANLRLRFASGRNRAPLIGTEADNVSGGVELRADDISGCVLTSRQACIEAYAVHASVTPSASYTCSTAQRIRRRAPLGIRMAAPPPLLSRTCRS